MRQLFLFFLLGGATFTVFSQSVNCTTYESSSSTTISEIGSPSISNGIFINDDDAIVTLSVNIDITHTHIGDLNARLLPASGGTIELFDRPGFPNSDFGCSQDNLLVSFSSNSSNSSTAFENTCTTSSTGLNNPGPPHAISGSYQPIGDLNSLANQSSSGLWTLEVNDNEAADGGILESWSITICYEVIAETLIASITQTNDISCNGGNEGALATTVEGGIPPYSFRLNGGPFQDENSFTGLAAGNYSVIVVDDLGTIAGTNTITISQPANLSANATVLENQITVNAQGGTPDYTYQLNGDMVQSSNIFNGLTNGNYTITIVDNNGCTTMTSATVTVNTLALNALLTNKISCFNDNDAKITITATGGTPPLQYRLNSGALQDSPVFDNLSAGTYTPEVVDSEGFTRQTTAITISNPPELTANLSVNTNTITVSALGGTPPLQYQLGNNSPQTDNVFTGVANGTYILRVIDANDCTLVLSATVAVNTLAINALLSDKIDCFNDNDAEIILTGIGGTPPLQYRLNGGTLQNSPVFDNLSAGIYTPEVVDSEGFTRQATAITINNPPELTANLSVNMNTITVSALGGTPPLQYQLGNNSPQTDNVFTGVANGTYTLRVIDANDCTLVLSATVAVNTLAINALLADEIDCFNDNDAEIILTVTGGTPPYQYRLNGGPLQGSPVFDNLPAGTYTPEVVDSEGFTRQATAITINNPPELTANLSVNMNTITVSALGGTPPLQYQLGNNSPQTDNVFTGVANGTYILRVIDANDCTLVLSATVAVNTLAINALLADEIDCFNDNDAEIILTVTGGTPPYQYRLNGGPLQGSPVFDNLPAGTYTPEVVDSEGFTRQATAITINNPPELTANLSVNMNTITVSALGGTPPLQYQLNDNSPQSNHVFVDLANGAYNIQIIDANGCNLLLPVTVLTNNMVVTTTLDSTVSCNDLNDAVIGVNVMGGTPPFLYSLNDGPFVNTPSFTGLGAGAYTVIVQDANGFFEPSDTMIIENPAPLLMEVTVDGSDLTINASGGTDPLEYSLGEMSWTSSAVFPDLPDAIYQASVRDANGCVVTEEAIIAVNSLLASVQLVDEVSCFGDQDASLIIIVEGGIIPYNFSLDGINFQDSNLFTDLEAGVYDVVVEDQAGAVFNTEFTITEPELLHLTLDIANNLITALTEGGVPPYNYQLNNGTPQNDPAFPDLAVGDYEITVTDANGCTTSQMASIVVGIFDFPNNSWKIKLYPNPNQGQFQLILPETIQHELHLYVYNTDGQLITHQTKNAMEASRPMYFNLEAYSTGVYQIVATDGNKRSVTRVLVK